MMIVILTVYQPVTEKSTTLEVLNFKKKKKKKEG